MKRIFPLFILLFIFLASCNTYKKYEDTNGENDYQLQEITEDMFISEQHVLKVAAVSNSTTKDGVTTKTLSVYRFDGVENECTFKAGTYLIKVFFQVKSGNARLALTDGKKIVHEFNVNEDNQEYEFTNDTKYYLKLAGEAAELEFKLEVTKK